MGSLCACAVVQMAELLKRMGLSARLINGDKDVVVKVPPTRSDILHACDIMEDVAIAYGYNNLTLTVPRTPTVARQQPLNKFTDLLRSEVAFAGYSEAFTFSLVPPPSPTARVVSCCASLSLTARHTHTTHTRDTRHAHTHGSARPRRIL